MVEFSDFLLLWDAGAQDATSLAHQYESKEDLNGLLQKHAWNKTAEQGDGEDRTITVTDRQEEGKVDWDTWRTSPETWGNSPVAIPL